MYKVLFFINKPVDPTVYNFKDLTLGKDYASHYTYMTNDFHSEEHCKVIISDFKSQCKANNIEMLSARMINKEFVSKEYL